MRLVGIAFIGLVSLAGCSITADAVPDAKGHAKTFVLHVDRDARGQDLVAQHLGLSPIFAATPATSATSATGLATVTSVTPATERDLSAHLASIDVATIATNALQLPSLVEGLRHDLMTFALAVIGFGVVGAVLAIRVRSKRREPDSWIGLRERYARAQSADARLMSAAVDVARNSPARRCVCDAEISARSRTGRCRRCARKARTRPRNVVLDMPAILAAATVVDVTEEGAGDSPKRVVLTESRIGQQRAYYTSESFS